MESLLKDGLDIKLEVDDTQSCDPMKNLPRPKFAQHVLKQVVG